MEQLSEETLGHEGWKDFVSSKSLYASYVSSHKTSGARGQVVLINRFVEKIQHLCPSATRSQKQDKFSGGRLRGLTFPDLQTARAEFEGRLGGSITW